MSGSGSPYTNWGLGSAGDLIPADEQEYYREQWALYQSGLNEDIILLSPKFRFIYLIVKSLSIIYHIYLYVISHWVHNSEKGVIYPMTTQLYYFKIEFRGNQQED